MPRGRSLPASEDPWKTLHVRVTFVRGRRDVYATVDTTFVAGEVGSTGVRPKRLWEGKVMERDPALPVTPEQGALLAQHALERAFPTLF